MLSYICQKNVLSEQWVQVTNPINSGMICLKKILAKVKGITVLREKCMRAHDVVRTRDRRGGCRSRRTVPCAGVTVIHDCRAGTFAIRTVRARIRACNASKDRLVIRPKFTIHRTYAVKQSDHPRYQTLMKRRRRMGGNCTVLNLRLK